jgi:hypothetical protein
MAITAKAGLGTIELGLRLSLAWGVKPDALVWMKQVRWGEDETPIAEPEPPPWPGLTEEQVREVAREFVATLVRTDAREADKRLGAHLRHYGCPQDQLATWRTHIKAVPLSTLTEEDTR